MMKIRINERQLNLIKENEEKAMALADKMLAKVLEDAENSGRPSYTIWEELGKKLIGMGMGEGDPQQVAKKYHMGYIQRNGKQLYQITIWERVYAEIPMTYVIGSKDPAEIRDILENGEQLADFHPQDKDGQPILTLIDWDDEGLFNSLENYDDDELGEKTTSYNGNINESIGQLPKTVK